MRRSLAVAAMAGALAVIPALPCWACSCAVQTPEQHAAGADAIFSGRVVEAEDPFRHSGPRVQAVLEVDAVYKGEVGDRAVVETYPGGSASCGLELRPGDRYTIFALLNERGRLESNLCSATAPGPIDPSRFGLSAPEAPGEAAPAGDAGEPARSSRASWYPVVALVASVAAVGVAIALAIRARRPLGAKPPEA